VLKIEQRRLEPERQMVGQLVGLVGRGATDGAAGAVGMAWGHVGVTRWGHVGSRARTGLLDLLP